MIGKGSNILGIFMLGLIASLLCYYLTLEVHGPGSHLNRFSKTRKVNLSSILAISLMRKKVSLTGQEMKKSISSMAWDISKA